MIKRTESSCLKTSHHWPGMIGLFLCSQAVTHLELLLIRTTSVILWHHFTPVIFSIALLGLGAGGILWTLLKAGPNKEVFSFPLALLFAAAVPLSFFVLTHTPLLSLGPGQDTTAFLSWGTVLLSLALPFFFGGALVGLWIIFSGEDAGRYYGINLIGSAAGSLSYLYSISRFGASGSLFLALCLVLAGAFSFSLLSGKRWIYGLSLLFFAAGVLGLFFAESLLPIRAPAGKRVFNALPREIIYTGWNAISRVDVMAPHFEGSPNLTVLIDGGAATTYIPRILGTLEQENPDQVRSGNPLIHRIRKQPKVLILGSGGGIDVRDFLVNGAREVTAVEINPLMHHLVQEKFADTASHLYRDPRVKVVYEDGRFFLTQTKELFDIIHLGLPITHSALASGAVNLSENSLLTEEAFSAYFSHLTEGGIFYLYHDELTALRSVATAAEALKKMGKRNLSEALAVITSDRSSGTAPVSMMRVELFLKKGSFTTEELAEMQSFAQKQGSLIRYQPGKKGNTYFHRFFTGQLERKDLKLFPELLQPVSDKRPFFAHLISWGKLFPLILEGEEGSHLFLNRTTAGEKNLLGALAILTVFVSICMAPGLVSLGRHGELKMIQPYLAYAGLAGFGFMCVELVLLGWLRNLWGHPETAAMGVLAVLLTSAGGGSLSVRVLNQRLPGFILFAVFFIILLCVLLSLGFDSLVPFLQLSKPAVRILIVLCFLVTWGTVLGMPFAWALQRLSQGPSRWTAWAWVCNLFASSLGAILGAMIAMDFGYSALLWTAAACYAFFLAVICLHRTGGMLDEPERT